MLRQCFTADDSFLAVTKLLEAIEERFSLMNHRMDELSTQLDHSQQESETQLKRVADAVEKLSKHLFRVFV